MEQNDKFPDVLCLENAGVVHGSRLFKLEKPYRFFSSKGLITIPAGFISDGYSIPSALWSWCNPFAKGMESSLFHDYFYKKDCPYNFTRAEADDLLLEGMVICGVSFLKRRAIYRAVRMFGGMSWKKR